MCETRNRKRWAAWPTGTLGNPSQAYGRVRAGPGPGGLAQGLLTEEPRPPALVITDKLLIQFQVDSSASRGRGSRKPGRDGVRVNFRVNVYTGPAPARRRRLKTRVTRRVTGTVAEPQAGSGWPRAAPCRRPGCHSRHGPDSLSRAAQPEARTRTLRSASGPGLGAAQVVFKLYSSSKGLREKFQ
jgi:hypothetical protein